MSNSGDLELSSRAPDQLGVAIRRVRKAQGLTQAELAKKAGVQQRTISKVENGQMNSELNTIFNILSALKFEMVIRSKAIKKSKKPNWMDS